MASVKKIHIFAGLALLTFLLSACHKQYLQGYYSRDEFIEACEWKYTVNEKYEPKAEWIDSIGTITDSADVQIYLGTFCSDSKKWVPRFFSMQDQLPIRHLEIISLDTTKVDSLGLAPNAGIKKVPTFIFLRDGEEFGRITEKPRMRLEKRVFRELKKL